MVDCVGELGYCKYVSLLIVSWIHNYWRGTGIPVPA